MPPEPSRRWPRGPRPCHWLGLFAWLTGAAQAEVTLIEQEQRYLLDASTRATLGKQLAAHHLRRDEDGAPRSHGLTEVEIETQYKLESLDAGGCALRELRVTVNLIVTLPEWKPAKPPEAGMSEAVKRMLRGLAAHEAGHRRHVMGAASVLERKMSELSDAVDCKQARRAAERIVGRELIRLRAREFNYDLATNDGRKQGAVLELTTPDRARLDRSASR